MEHVWAARNQVKKVTSARIAPINAGSLSRKRIGIQRGCYGVAEKGEQDRKATDGGCYGVAEKGGQDRKATGRVLSFIEGDDYEVSIICFIVYRPNLLKYN